MHNSKLFCCFLLLFCLSLFNNRYSHTHIHIIQNTHIDTFFLSHSLSFICSLHRSLMLTPFPADRNQKPHFFFVKPEGKIKILTKYKCFQIIFSHNSIFSAIFLSFRQKSSDSFKIGSENRMV